MQFLKDYAPTGSATKELHLMASGEAAIPALHAAALAGGQFRSLTVSGMIPTWEDVVRAPQSLNQAVNVVHGALKHYDLSDLPPLAGASRVTIRDTVDAMGNELH
jgi:hypothetical protein